MIASSLLLLALSVDPAPRPETIATPSTPPRPGSEMLDPTREARVQKLGKLLRCPVCQGLSIADSPSSTARAQLDRVRDLVAEGKSDEEIRDYFVARYGEWVLLQPTTHGVNVLVWGGPAILLAVGFLIILGQVKRKGAPPTLTAPLAGSEGEDEYLRAVRSELDR